LVFNEKSDSGVKMVEKFSFHLSGISVFQKIERRYLLDIFGYTSRIRLKFYEQIDHKIWNKFCIHHMT